MQKELLSEKPGEVATLSIELTDRQKRRMAMGVKPVPGWGRYKPSIIRDQRPTEIQKEAKGCYFNKNE